MIRVPLTNIHTPQFITIRLFAPPKREKGKIVRFASTIPIFDKLVFIGVAQGITKFVRDQVREIDSIFGFNGNEMQPAWITPGKMDTELRLHRVVFHNSDLLQELGFIRGNLITQHNPIVIIEDQYVLTSRITVPKELTKFGVPSQIEPNVTLGRSIIYHDCWIATNPISYDIMSNDLILIPEFVVKVGTVVTSEETSTTLFEDVFSSTIGTVTKWFNTK